MAFSREQAVSDLLINWVVRTLWMDSLVWHDYARRDETRREHYQTLFVYLQLKPFGLSSFQLLIGTLAELVHQADKSILLAAQALDHKLELPDEVGLGIHRNRLLKISREGAQMTLRDLGKLENDRRHASLTALALEGTATLTDEIFDLHDRIMIKLFATAKNKHKQQLQKQGKAINDKVRLFLAVGHALVKAKG